MSAHPPLVPGPDVEIVVPVRNEERDLVPSVTRLAAYLRESFAPTAVITITDNGSTDGTWALARSLADGNPGLIRAAHLDRPGRGRALHAIWSASDAPVVACVGPHTVQELESA